MWMGWLISLNFNPSVDDWEWSVCFRCKWKRSSNSQPDLVGTFLFSQARLWFILEEVDGVGKWQYSHPLIRTSLQVHSRAKPIESGLSLRLEGISAAVDSVSVAKKRAPNKEKKWKSTLALCNSTFECTPWRAYTPSSGRRFDWRPASVQPVAATDSVVSKPGDQN